jgi:hypothetical protein
MIESINNNGGGGGGVQTVVAGTGISVDNTDPENPIVTNTVTDTDDKVRVSVNDTTAGYLNGKLVAGTGIGLTENNNGLNETLTVAVSNLDASAITTGTVATARLGTGTANSSTYLAGDQTYKAAVTSVNGSTGAVTVAGGDTTYTVTTADAENTTLLRDIISFTVPGGTIADGESIWLEFELHQNNGTGTAHTLSSFISINGTNVVSDTQTTVTASGRYRYFRQRYYRVGNVLYVPFISNQQNYFPEAIGRFWGDSSTAIALPNNYSAQTPNFANAITIALRVQWSGTAPNVWTRVNHARAFKPTGQVT